MKMAMFKFTAMSKLAIKGRGAIPSLLKRWGRELKDLPLPFVVAMTLFLILEIGLAFWVAFAIVNLRP